MSQLSSVQTPGTALSPVMKSILLMVLSMLIIPFNDGIAKALTARYPVAEIVWGRYLFHFLLLLPLVAWKNGLASMKPKRIWLHLLRGAFTVFATFFFFWALSTLPMADTLALMFCYPLFITALSSVFLGEQVGLRRWGAVCAGMIGALIIIRPGGELFQWSSLLGVAAGLSMACYWIVTRRVAGSAPPLVAAAYAAIFGVIAMPILLPDGWVVPTLAHVGMVAAMGAIAAICHILMVNALDLGRASVLAPFAYTEIIMATTIGYVVFGDFPDTFTWIGIAIVIGAGVYISLRERQKQKGSEA